MWTKWMKLILPGLLMTGISVTGRAQGYVDQDVIRPIAESQVGDIDNVQAVQWKVYDFRKHNPHDGKTALQELNDSLYRMPGEMTSNRMVIVELANRVRASFIKPGRKLLIPTSFPYDFRAYSPYPFHYTDADSLPKLFLVDKGTQTFAAYESGKLVRWGLVSTGRTDDLTPAGRYNFNWKTEFRQSTEAPPGQEWDLYWVFNIDAKAGIHVHQYQLPISTAASHGCIRMTGADAEWNYNWAHQWTVVDGKVKQNGTPVIIFNDNPIERAAHWEVDGTGSVQSKVYLPADHMAIQPGSAEQRWAAWKSGR